MNLRNKKRVKKNKKTFEDNYDLPDVYNTTNITLIARDPFWIYAYWEISTSLLDQYRDAMGEDYNKAVFTLRMHDVSSVDFNSNISNNWFDIEVGPDEKSRYINIWSDNATYCAEIGLKTRDGEFFAFANSNTITTPRSSESERNDMIWMDVKDEKHQAYIYAEKQTKKVTKTLKLKEKTTPEIKTERKKILLTADDIKAYYANIFPLLRRTRRRPFRPKRRTISEIKQLSLLKRLKSNEDLNFEIAVIHGRSKLYSDFKRTFGASEEITSKGGASEQRAHGASENNHDENDKDRDFFFELGTELIVFGRTKPDAEVWHGDNKVELQKDGTFSMRFALPDGKIPLDFVAISNDKVDRRTISTSVVRTKTIYSP